MTVMNKENVPILTHPLFGVIMIFIMIFTMIFTMIFFGLPQPAGVRSLIGRARRGRRRRRDPRR